jgi:hypothetical protein
VFETRRQSFFHRAADFYALHFSRIQPASYRAIAALIEHAAPQCRDVAAVMRSGIADVPEMPPAPLPRCASGIAAQRHRTACFDDGTIERSHARVIFIWQRCTDRQDLSLLQSFCVHADTIS